MKSRWLIGMGLVLGVCVFATPAKATFVIEVVADCEGFLITVDGRHWECWDFAYTFTLQESGGATAEVSGVFSLCPGCPSVPDDWAKVCVEHSGSWGMLLCGTYTISMDYIMTAPARPDYAPKVGSWGPYTIVCPCNGGGEGAGTPGYWMNHPEAWPVPEIVIGGVVYPMAEAIMYMKDPVMSDKTYTMFPALVAAKLNVMIGTDPSCIADVIEAADEWMAMYGPVGSDAKGQAWKLGEPLYEILDDYNNGRLCAPSRD